MTNPVLPIDITAIVTAAQQNTKAHLHRQIADLQQRIDGFEQKYGLPFADFGEQFATISNVSILEKEADDRAWQTAIDALTACQRSLLSMND